MNIVVWINSIVKVGLECLYSLLFALMYEMCVPFANRVILCSVGTCLVVLFNLMSALLSEFFSLNRVIQSVVKL
ncbi:hypothetical protein HanRHA438_Chr17g0808421 [Helianthus annuus]|nr:hypothetical protein HanIR_Chr11g0549501 [Helianthus annuus]KAJ0825914.1 hypothetical protein HanRHA438_Chr17g0808421 [Helianthus annuus]